MGESIQVRLLRLAKPSRVLDNPAEGRPDGHHRQVLRRVRTGPRLPPDPRRAGPRRHQGLTRHGPRSWQQQVPLPVSPGDKPRRPCRRQTFQAGPTGWPGRHRHRARDETDGRHHAWSDPAGIRPPGGRHGLLLGEGSSGARSPVACAPDSSPRPRPWPCGTVHRSVVSRSSTRIEELDARRPDARNS